MKRYVPVAVLALAALAPLSAQAPKGWKMRVDRSTSASDPDAAGDIKFVTMGRASTPPIRRRRCTGIRPIPRRAITR